MGKKRIYVALCIVALAMLGMCFLYLKKTGWGMTGDKAWSELLDLDKNITLEKLEAKGYIDVTRQQAVDPGKCFSTDVIISDKDGVVTVTLKNIQNPTDPAEDILQDEVICKWKK